MILSSFSERGVPIVDEYSVFISGSSNVWISNVYKPPYLHGYGVFTCCIQRDVGDIFEMWIPCTNPLKI